MSDRQREEFNTFTSGVLKTCDLCGDTDWTTEAAFPSLSIWSKANVIFLNGNSLDLLNPFKEADINN